MSAAAPTKQRRKGSKGKKGPPSENVLQPRKSANANVPLLPSGQGNSQSDLRIKIAKNRAARVQQEQENAVAAAATMVHHVGAGTLAGDATAQRRNKKKKPLPSFLPDYESPGRFPEMTTTTTTTTTTATTATTATGTGHMSREMLEDLGLAPAAEGEQAASAHTEQPPAEDAEGPSAPSPFGAALLQRKVANQQARQHGMHASMTSPLGAALVQRKVANQQRRAAAAAAVASLPTLSFDAAVTVASDAAGEPSAEEKEEEEASSCAPEVVEIVDVILEPDSKAVEASLVQPEPEPVTAEPIRFEGTATKHSWLGGQCVAAASTSLASAAASTSSSQPSPLSSTSSRRTGLAAALILTVAIGLVLTATAGARTWSRSSSVRA
jgi:hypothetical protein